MFNGNFVFQVKYLDSQDSNELLQTGLMFLLPLNGEPNLKEMKIKMAEIYMLVPK
jgi:hypothetical protein